MAVSFHHLLKFNPILPQIVQKPCRECGVRQCRIVWAGGFGEVASQLRHFMEMVSQRLPVAEIALSPEWA